jgi:hypothetical protein
MRRRSALLLLALVAALPARAQVMEMPGLMPANWEAESRGMKEESLGLILPCAVNRISAKFRLTNPALRGSKLVPTVGIDFAVPRPAIEIAMLHVEDDGKGRPVLLLKKHGGPRPVPDIRFQLPLAWGKDVAVTMRWTRAGRIDVTAGGKTQSLTLTRMPEGVDLIVQAGKGAITNIRPAWEGPGQATACAKPLK